MPGRLARRRKPGQHSEGDETVPHSRSFAICRRQVLRAHEQAVRIVPQRDVAHAVVGERERREGAVAMAKIALRSGMR